STTGSPPSTASFSSCPPDQKPIQRPSGDQNGDRPPEVPGRSTGGDPSKRRNRRCGVPIESSETNTAAPPSGAITTDVPTSDAILSSTCSRISTRVGGSGGGAGGVALHRPERKAAASSVTPPSAKPRRRRDGASATEP